MVDRLVNSESNTRRIAFVEQCFGASGQPLKVPGRVLVGEGVLTKLCRKRPKPRQFFLFNDILVYGNILISKKKYNQQHIISLEDVKLENVDDEITLADFALRNGWKIISPKKSFVVYAATTTEKTQWMSHIKKCVNDLLLKRGITQDTANDSPVWVPDDEATVCMHCHKYQFSVINRRHHCRKCGKVVCGPCSSQKWLLPQQSSKPIRICLSCYNELSSAKSTNAGPPPAAMGAEDSSGEDSSDDDDTNYANVDTVSQDEQFQTYD